MTTTSTSTLLSDSISSLSSSSPQPPSVSRTYKQASQLFLTRQLAEAWQTLQPLVSLSTSDDSTTAASQSDPQTSPSVPIASASKTARVKVWSLWIAMVHEFLELGPEEGARVMDAIESTDGKSGSRRWNELAKSVKDADIWDHISQTGYSGIEAAVDPEVVATLATLLLSHAPSQSTTQARLESYLSASASLPTPAQLSSQLEQHQADGLPDKHASISSLSAQNGTSTPRDLGTRLKLLEIYALHVLPRNEEWEYARSFIAASEVLDEERKEAFLAALGSLREESTLQARREAELQRQREEEEQRRRRQIITQPTPTPAPEPTPAKQTNGGPRGPTSNTHSHTQHHATPTGAKSALKKSSTAISSSASSAAKRVVPRARPSTLLQRATLTVAAVQRAVLQVGASMSRNPMAIVRTLLVLLAMLVAIGRRDVRDRVGRAWEKVRGTVGMGVSVRYV